MNYALLVAGGTGTRLWPKSRTSLPKQLHNLISQKSMLKDAYEALLPLYDKKQIFLVSPKQYLTNLKKNWPKKYYKNIILEDKSLGTAMAVAIGMKEIAKKDSKAIVTVIWADAHIKKHQNFIKAVRLSQQVASEKKVVIIGVRPEYPATGFGYIKIGKIIPGFVKEKVSYIEKFVEKPNYILAQKFVKSGQYYWNPGISTWQATHYLEKFNKLMPKHALVLSGKKSIEKLEPTPIDYGIYEKIQGMVTFAADLGWSDVGSWKSLKQILASKKANHISGKHIGLATKNCLVMGKKNLIATLGVENLAIIDEGDVILVANMDEAEKIKELILEISKQGLSKYL